MSERRYRLVDCNPRRVEVDGNGSQRISFDCPEGHEGCRYTIPTVAGEETPAGWGRIGDDFATMTIKPSVRGVPKYASRESALSDGCIEEHLHPRMWCACHVVITNGKIEFCGDSK